MDKLEGGWRLRLKIAIPVAIGLAVIAWLFHGEFSGAQLSTVHFTGRAIACIGLAWIAMAGRDFGLTWRFREITDHHLSWAKALKINMLCEFTSAVTPSSVGGSTLGMVYMHREGIEWGRSATLMLTTLFLDELYFTLACPVILLLVPYHKLFAFSADTAFIEGLQAVFWVVYGALVVWTAVLFVGIFIRPQAVKALLHKLFRLPVLRRWSRSIDTLGDNIVLTGADLRRRPWQWWIKVFGGTCLSWCSRFMVINMLFLGFVPEASQLVVFGRQFIVWVVLMISPTPGGSGISEWIFKNYYGDLIAGSGALVMVLALFWRLISYYVYLIIGAVIVPRWVSDGVKLRRQRKAQEASDASSSS